MIRTNIESALDLLLELPRCLNPRPRAVRLMRCVKGVSNYELFRGCMDRFLKDYSPDRTAIDRQADDLLHRIAYGDVFDRTGIATELADVLGGGDGLEALLTGCIRDALMKHSGGNCSEDAIESVSINGLTKPRIDKLLDETFADEDSDGKSRFLVLRSGCKMDDDDVMHIPMLDFRIDAKGRNVKVVAASLRAAGAGSGVILNSGRSYHYLGFSLMSAQEFLDFAHRCLLLIPLIDARYLGHCLLDREFGIRVSGRSRQGKAPTVEQFLEVEANASEAKAG